MSENQTLAIQLNDTQRNYIREHVGHHKFAAIASAIGCSLSAVKEFAPLVFEERQAAMLKKAEDERNARRAAIEKREREFTEKARELFANGQVHELEEHWKTENAEEIIEAVFKEHSSTYDAVVEEVMESDEAEEAIQEEVEESRNYFIEHEHDGRVSQAYENVRDDNEQIQEMIKEAAAEELGMEVRAALKAKFLEFMGSLRQTV